MNGREQVKAYAALVAPASLSPGDKVRVGNNPTICTVVEINDPVVRLMTPRGVEFRCGWKSIRKVSDD